MSDLEDFLSTQSQRLIEGRVDSEPATPEPDPEEIANALARKKMLELIAQGGTIISQTVMKVEDDPHIQQFTCSQGHIVGMISSVSRCTFMQTDAYAICVVDGEHVSFPFYEPVGDEEADLLEALAEARKPREINDDTTSPASE